jgi:hypothetical protein
MHFSQKRARGEHSIANELSSAAQQWHFQSILVVSSMEADVTGTSPGHVDAMVIDSEKPESVGLGLKHCPVYHPTEEEFLNPLEFIGRIRQEAEQYGICKIVPPSSWNPPFMVDKDNFSFDTRIQSVNELQNKISSTPEYKAWNSKWLEFLKASGRERKRNPTFCGREIDLFKFYRLVEKRGGYAACCEKKLWREVARLLGVSSPALVNNCKASSRSL